MKKSKLWRALKSIGGSILMLSLISVCWLGSYYLSAWIYTLIGWEPHDLIAQWIILVGGFFILGTIMWIISQFTRKMHMDRFYMMTDALRRMAKGDFSVKIKVDEGGREHPMQELAKSINDMAEELGQLEQMRQDFISNVSHEIQSPLTSISGFAKLLRSDQLTLEERDHYLSIIDKESLRLAKLSENLLKLTSLESDHHPFEKKEYHLDKQLRHIILACEPQWMEKNLEMDIELEEVTVQADEDQMSQVWINLVHNSIKFTPSGGTIGVSVSKEQDQVVVRIRDTGIGIAAEHLPFIFDRFYKTDKSRNRTLGGSGLGLAIANKIVELHGGTIEVQSTVGVGTEFTVRLPVITS
ncbi:HAMP domain-containing histidine kinase [Paenibacillus sp. N1-5-1-14]|uniref:sensor histidine kinase n=1 Tax=Paenibacillus radicibacter TaxID=2972488 RepID=UPI002158ED0C|nr:HAMP domain-containing sensor histidine kinase [Paenibacillus radicibacter]MCR8643135.1 HAMP domain-containing histidine kinase [Paenibacillus radicibacter]